ncbi:hypothetical protein, partial [Photobacterium damselae]|uniref:hypothetical protein n=1 Tax=Photobacterium damselae TaxID=38293 RepID=UPI0014326ECB
MSKKNAGSLHPKPTNIPLIQAYNVMITPSTLVISNAFNKVVTPIDLLMVKFTFYKRSNNLIVHL